MGQTRVMLDFSSRGRALLRGFTSFALTRVKLLARK